MAILNLGLTGYCLLVVASFIYIRNWIEHYRFQQFAKANGCVEAPRPPRSRFWGLEIMFKLLVFKGDILDDFLYDRFTKVGWTYFASGILGRSINTVEPKNIQTILAYNFKDYDLGDIRKGLLRPFIGSYGIFTADGRDWEVARAMMRPQFSREQISQIHDMEEHMHNLYKMLPTDSTGWTSEVDISALFYRFTLDVATDFLFGESVLSQLTQATKGKADSAFSGQKEDEMDFAEAFTYAQDFCAFKIRLSQLYWIYSTKKFRHACEVTHRFTDRFVDLALNPHKHKQHAVTNEKKDVREKFVLLQALAQETKDPLVLRDQILNILIAGRDTTATLLSWCFHLLPQYPDVWARLRKEVLDTFPPGSDITFEGIKSMKFLRNVLNESLRLFPAVPFNLRVAVKDTILPVGGGPDGTKPIAVKKNWPVTYSVYVMHRRKDLWGEDALEFRPDRWEGRKVGWEYLPFNGGPRICIGQQYALTEASFVVIRLLQRFSKIESMQYEEKVSKLANLTLSPAKGVKVRFYAEDEKQ